MLEKKLLRRMGEESVTTDRAVEQAIVSLKKGAHLLKFGRKGKPKFCPFRLSTDEKLLIWYSGKEARELRLSAVTNITRGQETVNFQRHPQPEKEPQSFSLVYANGECTLDLICKDKEQADSWFLGLRALISRSNLPKSSSLWSRRGAQTCVNSPVGYSRRKQIVGLLEGSNKVSQVHSLCGSPQSMRERCLSDALSYSSGSFYSSTPRTLSNIQTVTDIEFPHSFYLESDNVNEKKESYTSTECHRNLLNGVSSHAQYFSASDKNDILRDVFLWGEGLGGILGGGVDRYDTSSHAQSDSLLPKLLESTMMLEVRKISLGRKHAGLVTKQGDVYCWGEGSGGKLGHKTNMDVSDPKIVESLNEVHVESISCSEHYTCALTLSGELYTWGDSSHDAGFIGDRRNRSKYFPLRLSGPLDGIHISSVACGEWHMAIVSSSGQLYTFGNGTFGVLGHGNLQSISQPKEVESLKGFRVRLVACGPWHMAAIVDIMVDHFKNDVPCGKLFTWGDGDEGRLGHADLGKKLLPTCVAKLVDHDFVQVSCGTLLTVGLTDTGIVYTMGSKEHGQLGNPQARDKSITIVEGKLKGEFVKQVSSGSYHVAVLTSRKRVYTWGKGANGRLGLGDIGDRNSPTLVEALRDRQVENIACGSSSTSAICLHKFISSSDQSFCNGCRIGFGFTRKKHNCYNCGFLFCRPCSSKKVMNASLAPNKNKPFRVCDPCYQVRNNGLSDRVIKLENPSPRLTLSARKACSDLKVSRGEATLTQGPLCSPKLSSQEEAKCIEGQTLSKPVRNDLPLEPISPFLSMLPRWGQVPIPPLFSRYDRENFPAFHHISGNESPAAPSVHSQKKLHGSKSTCLTAMGVNNGISESEKILADEVEHLRAEVNNLEKQCQMKSKKIYEYQLQIEGTWLIAREEAAKRKDAKEVIRALKARLQVMLGKHSTVREANTFPVLANGADVHLPHTPTCADIPDLAVMDPLLVTNQLPPEVVVPRDRVNGPCSPISSCETLSIMCARDLCNSCTRPVDDSHFAITDSRQTITKTEWVEQDEPGVYITLMSLPSRRNGLKRVRFSRKRYNKKEAEQWWKENQLRVYGKYDIESHISPSTKTMEI
ncbi:PH, RCC1 and FYVE domains-containing protein 1-like [Telopea speciosissima]|uniref:PH, RCC1 and FYVE domains-containing protein 1-like n=1 Tax=Telopea speciosissima TaxID=54955 RepID=UPI001CC68C96|nr:PH, RCC1 and FYVE domains-containing protein 1-like [Telopea speciosissima]